jgi:hypothetical protein
VRFVRAGSGSEQAVRRRPTTRRLTGVFTVLTPSSTGVVPAVHAPVGRDDAGHIGPPRPVLATAEDVRCVRRGHERSGHPRAREDRFAVLPTAPRTTG